MIDSISPAVESLAARHCLSVDDADLLESLAREVAGFLVSDGWKEPDGQKAFIARRLTHYALQFGSIIEVSKAFGDILRDRQRG